MQKNDLTKENVYECRDGVCVFRPAAEDAVRIYGKDEEIQEIASVAASSYVVCGGAAGSACGEDSIGGSGDVLVYDGSTAEEIVSGGVLRLAGGTAC